MPFPRTRQHRVRFFLLSWLMLSVAGVAWSLLTPLFQVPDEAAHVIKAVALVRGQLTGETVVRPGGYFPSLDEVRIPAYYGTNDPALPCFADPAHTSVCRPGYSSSDATPAEVLTNVGRYPPAYYAVVGLPSLVAGGTQAVHLMRAAGAVLGAAFLALGLTALRGSRLPRTATAVGLLGITPTTLFLAGSVNPSSLEIALGFATWAVLLPAVVDPSGHLLSRRLLVGATLAALFVNVRPASAVMGGLIALSLLTLSNRRFWAAVRPRDVWRKPAAIAVVGATAALLWTVIENPMGELGGTPAPELASPVHAVAGALRLSGRYLHEQIDVFGLLDVPGPAVTTLIWAALLGTLVAAALALSHWPGRLALVTLLVLVVLVPVVAQVPGAARYGLGWQGRYLLPYSSGLPLVAGALLQRRRDTMRSAAALAPIAAALAGLGQVAAAGWALWHYTYGWNRLPLVHRAQWTPPLGLGTALLLLVVAVAGLTWLVLRIPAQQGPEFRGEGGSRSSRARAGQGELAGQLPAAAEVSHSADVVFPSEAPRMTRVSGTRRRRGARCGGPAPA